MFIDDDIDKIIDLFIVCYFVGCGYSVCDIVDEIFVWINVIIEYGDGILVIVVDVVVI